jgi:PAS domain S-box-containing protein
LLEDITVARNEYVSLSAKEELWRFAIEGSGEGVCVYDCITGHLQLSGKFKELVGYDANEHIEEHVVSNLLHKEDADEFFNEILPHITQDNPIMTLEQRLRNKNGEYRWYLSKGKGLEWDVNGHPGKIIGTLTDIHEKKITEISLKTANNQLLLLINNLDAGVVFENEDNQCLLNNNQVFDILRIPSGNCNSKTIEGNFINQDWVVNQFANPDIFKRLTEALCIHKIPSHDNVCTLNDDSVIALCYIPVNVEGINKGHIWKLRDITATHKQEEEIRLLKNHYHKILNEIPADIFVLSPLGESIFANRFAEKNVDFTIDWQPLVDEISRTRIATQQLNIAYNAEKPIHYCLRTFAPIYDNEGQLEFIVSHSADITELKNIEAQLNTQKDYYTHILDTIPIDIVILDREHRFTYINHNAVKDADEYTIIPVGDSSNLIGELSTFEMPV